MKVPAGDPPLRFQLGEALFFNRSAARPCPQQADLDADGGYAIDNLVILFEEFDFFGRQFSAPGQGSGLLAVTSNELKILFFFQQTDDLLRFRQAADRDQEVSQFAIRRFFGIEETLLSFFVEALEVGS